MLDEVSRPSLPAVSRTEQSESAGRQSGEAGPLMMVEVPRAEERPAESIAAPRSSAADSQRSVLIEDKRPKPAPRASLAELADAVERVATDYARQAESVPPAAFQPTPEHPVVEASPAQQSQLSSRREKPAVVLQRSDSANRVLIVSVPSNLHRLGKFVRRGDRLGREPLRVTLAARVDGLPQQMSEFLAQFLGSTTKPAYARSEPIQVAVTDPDRSAARAMLETAAGHRHASSSRREHAVALTAEGESTRLSSMIRPAPEVALRERRQADAPPVDRRPIEDLVEGELTPPRGAAPTEVPQTFDPALKPLQSVDTNISTGAGTMPRDYATSRFAEAGEIVHCMGFSRAEVESLVFWEAPALAHRPLYFEEVNLERHGFSIGIFQPALSAAHFFGRVPALPYLMHAENDKQSRYTLGHYRPGSPAPYELYVPPFSVRGSMAQTIAVIGLMYAIP
jgi:hypothetical protein